MPSEARWQSFCMSIIKSKDAWPFSLSSWAELQLQMVISTLDWTRRLQAILSFPRGKSPAACLLAVTGQPLQRQQRFRLRPEGAVPFPVSEQHPRQLLWRPAEPFATDKSLVLARLLPEPCRAQQPRHSTERYGAELPDIAGPRAAQPCPNGGSCRVRSSPVCPHAATACPCAASAAAR